MSDAIQHIDVDSEEFENTPKALRDHVKKLQQALTSSTQTIAEYRERETAQALNGVLTGFKNPERVKRDLLSDKVDPLDNEAVTKWLEANGGDYARGEANPDPAPDGEQPDPAAAYQPLQLGGRRVQGGNPSGEGDRGHGRRSGRCSRSAAGDLTHPF